LSNVALAQIGGLQGVREVERPWKLHRDVAAGRLPSWAVAPRAEGASEDTAALCVLFHPDIERGFAETLCASHGGVVRSELQTINAVIVELPVSQVASLADEDAIQWIEPPIPALQPHNDGIRYITQVDQVQAVPYGLDGSGVNILLFDEGAADTSHPDLAGRIYARDGSPTREHST
jgi:hypothetical protein